jgi:hypothetical protein
VSLAAMMGLVLEEVGEDIVFAFHLNSTCPMNMDGAGGISVTQRLAQRQKSMV